MSRVDHAAQAAVGRAVRRVRTQRDADPAGFHAWLNQADPLAPDRIPPMTRREHLLACGVPAHELGGTAGGQLAKETVE